MELNYKVVILFILLIYLLYTFFYRYSENAYMKSDVDNKIYLIRRGNNKSQQFLKDSANALAIINHRVETLINYLVENYSNDLTKNYFIKHLRTNYNSYMISEAAVDPKYTTYTIDKEDMRICLRTRDVNEKIYDINTLFFVVAHELSHLCNYTREGAEIIGHGKEFRIIFAFLINTSIKLGLYRYQDYSKNPVEYCNIIINSAIT
jgi:hypothetical protein